MFGVVSHFPLTWYAPIATATAIWFLAAAVYTNRKGYTYAGRRPGGGYRKVSKTEDPMRFRLWLILMIVACVVFSSLAIGAFMAHPIA